MTLMKRTSFFTPFLAAFIWIIPGFLRKPTANHAIGGMIKEENCRNYDLVSPTQDVSHQPLASPTRSLHDEIIDKNGLEEFDYILQPLNSFTARFNESATEDVQIYVRPDVSTFYRTEPGTFKIEKPSFNGQAGKFVNMSPDRLQLFWDPMNGQPGLFIATVGPFESAGTATFPTHQFYFADYQHEVVRRFSVTSDTSLYVYDPFNRATAEGIDHLPSHQRSLYESHLRNLDFAEEYKKATGAEWLTMYPRSPPRYPMWKADYFGQKHSVWTKETHFEKLPPNTELGRITAKGSARRLDDREPRLLSAYRSHQSSLELTLTVLSCAPKVFEINNFLSEVEVDHILNLAHEMHLHRSTTGSGDDGTEHSVRTSMNTWVNRDQSPIIDAIYRRAADVLRIDEALLRTRGEGERHFMDSMGARGISIAEDLQLVHYDVGQEYTAHHDFGYSRISDKHSSNRYANLILYLNEGMVGGETSFPRWMNAETSSSLDVTPKKGKAVLFYSLLPDGNSDELSQHAALPVRQGEKWMTNLWVWDPYRD